MINFDRKMKIDFTYLEMVSDGDTDFVKQFIDTFKETYTTLTAKIEKEFADKDFENLGRTAHQLKPSAKMLLLPCSETLEKLQHEPSTATADMLAAIRSECEEAMKQLLDFGKEKGVD